MEIIRRPRRTADPAQAFGFRLVTPPGVRCQDPPEGIAVSLVEESADGRTLAELDFVPLAVPFILDPPRVLDNTIVQVARSFIDEPREGCILETSDLTIGGQRARRIATRVDFDEEGMPPALRFQTAVLLTPPDPVVEAVLLIVIRSAVLESSAVAEVLASLRLDCGRANAHAAQTWGPYNSRQRRTRYGELERASD